MASAVTGGDIVTYEQIMHHWLLQQNQGIGRYVPNWIKNQPWNLMPVRNQAFHIALHGQGRNPFGILGRFWFGTPTWFKAGSAEAGLRVFGAAENEARSYDMDLADSEANNISK